MLLPVKLRHSAVQAELYFDTPQPENVAAILASMTVETFTQVQAARRQTSSCTLQPPLVPLHTQRFNDTAAGRTSCSRGRT